MARQQRNDVDYFPHYVTHGRKMFIIRSKYGIAGYAIWFLILEELGKANYHFLDLKDEQDVMYVCAQCSIDESTFLSIIEDLVKLGSFDKELWAERILWNQAFVDSIQDAYKKRSNNCITREELIQILTAKGRLNGLKVTPNGPKSHPIELKDKLEAIEDSERVKVATHKIAEFFGVSEISQASAYIKIGNFVRYQESVGQIDLLSSQFTAYKAVKTENPKFRHKWPNYIGDPDKSYENGAWNQFDWNEELKKVNSPINQTRDSKAFQ